MRVDRLGIEAFEVEVAVRGPGASSPHGKARSLAGRRSESGPMVLRFGRKTHARPLRVGRRLTMRHVNRPRVRQRDLFAHQTQTPGAVALGPKVRHRAALLDEAQPLAVGDRIRRRHRERRHAEVDASRTRCPNRRRSRRGRRRASRCRLRRRALGRAPARGSRVRSRWPLLAAVVELVHDIEQSSLGACFRALKWCRRPARELIAAPLGLRSGRLERRSITARRTAAANAGTRCADGQSARSWRRASSSEPGSMPRSKNRSNVGSSGVSPSPRSLSTRKLNAGM